VVTGVATVNTPTGVAVDPALGRIYWANFLANKLSFANLNGSGGGDLTPSGVTPNHPTFPVLLPAPAGTGEPAVSGTPVVGATLSCSQGNWAPDLPSSFDYRAAQSFTYGWSDSGTPIAATTSITGGSPGSYACQVIASNHTGSTAQGTEAFTIPRHPLPRRVPDTGRAREAQRVLGFPRAACAPTSRGVPSTAKKKTGATVRYIDMQASTTTLTCTIEASSARNRHSR
jgi:hypothetical protein